MKSDVRLYIWCVFRRICVFLFGCGIIASRSHCNDCTNVTWGLCWGGSRGTKPFICSCKVAATSDERHLACAAVASTLVLMFFVFPLVFCNEWLFMCAKFYVFNESLATNRNVMVA